jgi:hypothetical protein
MFRRLAALAVVALVMASCSSGGGSTVPTTAPPVIETTSTSQLPTTPVVARILSPERGTVQGSAGKGMVVVLTFTARDPSVLQATYRAPGATTKSGHNPAFPGLVVTLSTSGTAVGGPSANLANLFQIVSPSLQLDGSLQVTAVWTSTSADFGSDVDASLVAFVVSGTAPDTVPETQANLDVISNPAEVTFRMSPLTGGAVAAGPSTSSTTAPGASTSTTRPTTTTVGATTTTTRSAAPTTTTRPPATTVAPTTSTTKFLGLF